MKRLHACTISVGDMIAILLEKGTIRSEEIETLKIEAKSYSPLTREDSDTTVLEVRWEDK